MYFLSFSTCLEIKIHCESLIGVFSLINEFLLSYSTLAVEVVESKGTSPWKELLCVKVALGDMAEGWPWLCWVNSMILKVFSNLNDAVVLFKSSSCV